MIVTKLFSSEKKVLEPRPVYQKTKHKTYRELLQLDRPRKQIEYESSSEEQDFLEKLLKQEKKKDKKSKSSSRKNTAQNSAKTKKEEKKPTKTLNKASRQKSQQKSEAQQPEKESKKMDEIEMFLAQNKVLPSKYDDLLKEDNPESTGRQLQPLKAKSSTALKTYVKADKSKILRRDMALSSPMLIDTKSIESPPILFNATNHVFTSSLRPKHFTNACEELLAQKQNYKMQYKIPTKLTNTIASHDIEHIVSSSVPESFSFQPNIDSLNPNWRIAMTINPLKGKPPSKFTDRKYLFRDEKEEERFVKSLRSLSRLRR